LPDIQFLNANVIHDDDYVLLKNLLGSVTIKQVITKDFLFSMKEKIEADPAYKVLFYQRLDEAKVQVAKDVDKKASVKVLIEEASKFIGDFVPTAISIVTGSLIG
jgi:hypothetical protein